MNEYVDDKLQEELNKWDLEIARDKGIEQGIKQRNIEIAKLMLESNVPIADISKYTGLSIEELELLKEQ